MRAIFCLQPADTATDVTIFRTLSRTLFLAVLLVLGTACTDASLTAINTLARFGDYTYNADISYGPEPLNRLDVYVPTGAGQEPLPTVVFFYGGCWGGCKTWPKESYRFVAEALTSEGFVAVLADYRLYPQVRFPQIMEDASAAVNWVAKNIADYGGDSERIYLMGHSAGAHMAAMLTINQDYLAEQVYNQVSGFIGLAGPYDFLPLTKPYQKQVFGPPPEYPASQPINYVDGSEPPLLLLYGDKDTVVKPRNLENLEEKVKQLRGRVVTRRYPEADHASIVAALASPLRGSSPVLEDIARFVRSTGLSSERSYTTTAPD